MKRIVTQIMVFFVALFFYGCTVTPSLESEQKSDNDKEITATQPLLKNKNEKDTSETQPNVLELGNGFVLNNFARNQKISSPLQLTGVAPRKWFFEGSFSVTILNKERGIIQKGFISGEKWMELLPGKEKFDSNDLIDFQGEIKFEIPTENSGILLFEQNDPSDGESGKLPQTAETSVIW